MSEQNNFIPCQGNKTVQQLTQDLIVKINQINELNIYKYSLFNNLFTTEMISHVDPLVLEELAALHKLKVGLPSKNLPGSWVQFEFKWGHIFVVSYIKLN